MTESPSNFATTQWTLVLKAAAEDSQHGRPALEEVIRRYWQPLYSFARRRGLSREDAEDATQEFLGGVLEGKVLELADPTKGKFRTYLLTAWKRFLVDQFRKENAQKRGGRETRISLDFGIGEQRWLELESREPDPERLFIRTWAESVLEDARQRLRAEYAGRERNQVFETLMPLMTQTLDFGGYEQLAKQLNLTSGAIKVALHRLRQRFGQTLRNVVQETLEDPSEVDQELSELLNALQQS